MDITLKELRLLTRKKLIEKVSYPFQRGIPGEPLKHQMGLVQLDCLMYSLSEFVSSCFMEDFMGGFYDEAQVFLGYSCIFISAWWDS